MHLILSALAVLFLILGFAGFALGGLPTLVFWILAGGCIAGAWKMRSDRQRRHEIRNLGPEALNGGKVEDDRKRRPED